MIISITSVLSEKCVYKVSRPCRESHPRQRSRRRAWDSGCADPNSRAWPFQHSNGSVTAAPDAALGHFCEESLHQVQPTSAGRREVNVIARVSRQPVSNLGDLVGTVVVHHQMHVQPGGKIVLDLVEKPQELLVPVPAVAIADGHTRCYIHSRKQRRNSMPLVIVRLPSGNARRQR